MRAICFRRAISTPCDQIPEIVQIGISALKIEGRYKDADYVALTTRAYRQAVDDAWAGARAESRRRQNCSWSRSIRAALGPHFLNGTNHQAVVQGPRAAPSRRADGAGRARSTPKRSSWSLRGRSPRAAETRRRRGVRCGRLAQSRRNPKKADACSRRRRAAARELRFGNGVLRYATASAAGDLLWRTHDPDLDKAARPYIDASRSVAQAGCFACDVTAREGAPLETEWMMGRPERDGDVRVLRRWARRGTARLNVEYSARATRPAGKHAV